MSPEMRDSLHQSLRKDLTAGTTVAATLSLVLRERVWEERVDDHGRVWRFGSFLEYLTANPPGGLYTKLDEVRPLIDHDVRLLAMFDAEVARPHGGDRRGKKDNIQLEPSPSGTSKQAGVRRLRRERPDLLEEVKAGSKSVHAACVEAGFRKRLTGLEAAQADFQVAA